MNKLILTFLVCSVILYSCENSKKEISNIKTETENKSEHQHEHDIQTIELNKGEKWKVEPKMLKHIRTMESNIMLYAESNDIKYKALSNKLQSNIDLLTSNCTMTGKAHDELHKWLLPYIDLVQELNQSKTESEASLIFKEIQLSFSTFNNYFQ